VGTTISTNMSHKLNNVLASIQKAMIINGFWKQNVVSIRGAVGSARIGADGGFGTMVCILGLDDRAIVVRSAWLSIGLETLVGEERGHD
jgi:hypothetical protein